MDASFHLLFFLLLPFVSVHALPLTTPDGIPNMAGIMNHVTHMEQTMKSLQTQVQATNTELSTVKGKLKTTEAELNTMKSQLRAAENDITVLRIDLQRGPGNNEFANLKSEVESLKVSHSAEINSTVFDAVNVDVKSNSVEIQSLKSQILATKAVVNKTTDNTNRKLNSMETRLLVVEAASTSTQSRLNSNEQDLTSTKAKVLSTTADVDVIKSQVSTISGDVNGIRQGLSGLENNTAEDVVFQVSESRYGTGPSKLSFDTVDYSRGGGYDSGTGTFTAPVSGTFIFWANVGFYRPAGLRYVSIVKEQQLLTKSFTRLRPDDNGDDHGVASVMTVVHLDKGETVHFTTESSQNSILGGGESFYGGALLHATR